MTQGQLENSPKCPNSDCKRLLDGYTSVRHDGKPSSGDITICAGCAWVLVFDDDLQLGIFQIGAYMKLSQEQQNDINMAQHYIIAKLEREGLH